MMKVRWKKNSKYALCALKTCMKTVVTQSAESTQFKKRLKISLLGFQNLHEELD